MGKIIFKKKVSPITEDDGNGQTQNAQQNNAAQQAADSNTEKQASVLYDQINRLQNQIVTIKADANRKVDALLKQIQPLNQKLVLLGKAPVSGNSNESVDVDAIYHNVLNESIRRNRTREFSKMIHEAFRRVDDISYVPMIGDDTDKTSECFRIARNWVEYIDSQNWDHSVSHWTEFARYIRNYFKVKRSHRWYSEEIEDFIDCLESLISESKNSEFGWILG